MEPDICYQLGDSGTVAEIHRLPDGWTACVAVARGGNVKRAGPYETLLEADVALLGLVNALALPDLADPAWQKVPCPST